MVRCLWSSRRRPNPPWLEGFGVLLLFLETIVRPNNMKALAWTNAASTRTRMVPRRHGLATTRRHVVHTASESDSNSVAAAAATTDDTAPQRIAIVGGGLAGLSVCYHLLRKTTTAAPRQITILDICHRSGGASAVAGGLIHPFSPRGKLVHWGLEGLRATNELLTVASQHRDGVVLRDELYRLAVTEAHTQQFRKSAQQFPDIAEWSEDVSDIVQEEDEDSTVVGRLRFHSGCCVIHVPTYLEGLFEACQELAAMRGSTVQWQTKTIDTILDDLDTLFDVSVLCAGSGAFADDLWTDSSSKMQTIVQALPVQLVRGQSLELKPSEHHPHALLCGKYVAPLPNGGALIGATHEFSKTKLTKDQVVEELKSRTVGIPWDNAIVDRVTSGVRVQSERGKYGRRPIAGRLLDNLWIFAGLSSRGLLYHALYADMLTDAIVRDSEKVLLDHCPDFLWWK